MKGIYQVFVLMCVTIIFLTGLGKDVRGTTPGLFELAQSSSSSNQRALEVAMPESALVRLITGGSYTGELTAFNSTDLTISANGYSETVPLSKIQQVEFQGNVWISNPDGTTEPRRIRGISQTLRYVPLTALTLMSSSGLAKLNLEEVLSQEEYDQLSSDSNLIHVVRELLFETPGEMTVTVVVVRR